jgi:hypothetical protein
VEKELASVCQVQHAPWDVSDGGAGATTRGMACLDNYLVTQAQQPYKADVILYNFGLHDLSNSTKCEAEYMSQLSNITTRLATAVGQTLPLPAANTSKIGFMSTTPFMPLRKDGNTVVEDMNRMQSAACKELNLPYIDLYKVVVDHCGPVPYPDCDICRVHPCSYHYNAQGEALQAKVVAQAFRDMLAWQTP